MFRLRNAIIAWIIMMIIFIVLIIIMLTQQNFIIAILLAGLMYFVLKVVWKISWIANSADWVGNVDTSPTIQEWVQFPTKQGTYLWGLITRDLHNPETPKPYIIVGHGAGGNAKDFDLLSVALAISGYHVFAFNQSGHGNGDHISQGNNHNYPEMMLGLHDAVDFVLNQPDLIPQNNSQYPRIGFVGLSSGGIMALTQAYLNDNVKVTIAISGVHDFNALVHRKFPFFDPTNIFKIALRTSGMILNYNEEENRIISPKYCLRPNDPSNTTRVFMIHAKNDMLPFEDALANKELAGIPNEHCLFPEWGGHNIRCQETVVIAQILKWFNDFL
jgi:predicted esterase